MINYAEAGHGQRAAQGGRYDWDSGVASPAEESLSVCVGFFFFSPSQPGPEALSTYKAKYMFVVYRYTLSLGGR